MKKFTLLVLIFACCVHAFAQNTISGSAISFKIKNIGIYTSGTIGGLQANVHFNPADLASSTATASLEVSTLNTDNSMRDEHLKSDEFFDLAHYPRITLKSILFKHKSGNNYIGTFSLTIKDKTKQVDIPFSYVDKGTKGAFSASFKLNRRDYGVGSDSFTLSDEVTITITAEGSK